MLRTSTDTIGTTEFQHAWSDAGMYVRQVETGELYEDCWDPIPPAYTYEESDIPIPYDEVTDEDYAQAGRILLGEEVDGNG